MPELKYRSPRPPAFTIIRETATGEIRYCADVIQGVIGHDLEACASIPQIAFVCSGQITTFPAAELKSIEIAREGGGHCNHCDRLFESYIE